MSSIKVNRKILLELLDYLDEDEVINLYYKPSFISEGEIMGSGIYFLYDEIPEEGFIGPFNTEPENTCSKCGQVWSAHEFAVPEPYCP